MQLLRDERDRARRVEASGTPPIVTSPAVGAWKPASTLASVVLPAPDRPTSATRSPGGELQVDAVQHVVPGGVGVADPAQRRGGAGGHGAPPGGSGGAGIVATPTSRASAASARWASSIVPSTMLNWSNRRTNRSAPAVAPPTESASARTSRKPATSTAAVPASSPQLSRV